MTPQTNIRRVPELLAPAGDGDCLRAAVACGADAVYFGVRGFNARQRAVNFGLEELPEVMDYLHDRNVKGYVALNTLIFCDEWEAVSQQVAAMARAGADAVIVQDLGLARMIRRMAPTLAIHASTQMTQTEAGGINRLCSLGISRVIVARELTLAELTSLARQTAAELEVFVHGAMCISYSGQCLASEAELGRSANRGLCAQLCRQPYRLEIDGRRCQEGRPYPLSAQDLMGLAYVPALTALGVAGLKIEGRLKTADYVAAATRLYRLALDAAAAEERFVPPQELIDDLLMAFSRGTGSGYLGGVDSLNLVHGRFPKKRGLPLGTVAALTPRGVVVELGAGGADRSRCAISIKPGDGVLIDGGASPDGTGGRVYSVEPPAGGSRHIELVFGRDGVDLAGVRVGAGVWKTDDPQAERRLARLVAEGRYRRTPLVIRAEGRTGERLRIAVRQPDGLTVEVETAEPPAAARRHPLTTKLLREHFGRLGGTPFELAEVELCWAGQIADAVPVMVPLSVLNDLRRRVVDRLIRLRRKTCRHTVEQRDAVELLRCEREAGRRERPHGPGDQGAAAGWEWSVLVRDPRQVQAAATWTPAVAGVPLPVVYVEASTLAEVAEAVAMVRAAGRKVALVTPRVLMPGEEEFLRRLADLSPDGVLVRNLGAWEQLRQARPDLRLVGDASLNIVNELSAGVLRDWGLSRWTPGADLTWAQLAALCQHISAPEVEVVLHQRLPLFHTRHQVGAPVRRTRGDGSLCGERISTVVLSDRRGARYRVVRDALGRDTVYDKAVQSAARLVPAMIRSGLRSFRVELLDETAEQTAALLDLYSALLAGRLDPQEAWSRLNEYNGGEITEGTWTMEEARPR